MAPETGTVIAFLGRGGGRWMGGPGDARLVAELRALLRVSRAANDVIRLEHGPATTYSAALTRLAEALIRLDRASGRGRR